MKRTIKLAVVAALALGSTSAFATNGDLMIGQGAKSRAMGGVGIAKSFGADSGLANPALISSVKNMEVTGTLTVFMPSVSFSSNAGANAQAFNPGTGAWLGSQAVPAADSGSDLSFIPEIAFAQRLTENFVYGISTTGVAGMGVDYKDALGKSGAFGMQTNLQIAKIAVPLSYTVAGVSLGLAPVMQLGSLQINYAPDGVNMSTVDADLAYSFGVELAVGYDLTEVGVEGLTLGAVYKSKIAMEYTNQISRAMSDFGVTGVTSGDSLDQPAEIGVGVSYSIAGNTIALDYKMIQWSDAKGYADFGWEDQSVIALGYEYAQDAWAARVGYNYASSPIAEQVGAGGLTPTGIPNYDGAAVNFFNLAGFPGVIESHITLGGTYNISDAFGLDASFVYAPEVTQSFDVTAMSQGLAFNGTIANGGTPAQAGGAAGQITEATAEVTHSQMGITVAATYKF